MFSGRRKLISLFLITLLLVFEINTFIPTLKVCLFIPLIAYLIYELRFVPLLWVALFSGLMFDSIGSQYVFGAHAFSFTVSAALAYRLKKIFFKERKLTLFFITFCLSVINTLLLTVLFSNLSISAQGIKWIGIDLLFYSFLEGVIGFTIFTLPFMILSSLKVLKKPTERHSYGKKRPQ